MSEPTADEPAAFVDDLPPGEGGEREDWAPLPIRDADDDAD